MKYDKMRWIFSGITIGKSAKSHEKVRVHGDLIQSLGRCFILPSEVPFRLTNVSEDYNNIEGIYSLFVPIIEVDFETVKLEAMRLESGEKK